MILILACGTDSNISKDASKSEPVDKLTDAGSEGEAKHTNYLISKGREVQVPVNPQRVVYIGSDPGDLLALGVKPLGSSLQVIGTQVAYPDLLGGMEDIGYPANLEKIIALNPDLIVFNDWDDKAIDSLAKIDPTVVIGEVGTFERLERVAEIFGKKTEADSFITNYQAKAEKTKELLNLDIQSHETATVLLQMGEQLYVIGHQGLSVSLYECLVSNQQKK
ncbi:ABC transporter substrate-binding protein [Bacillus sp. FSL K6-3431]|uniref:ABC transporter substrate-binding protein n=1 Tax=Bacillus sp. FSL K6-3431 TaxID=2921500 RepID=UPI0030FB2976